MSRHIAGKVTFVGAVIVTAALTGAASSAPGGAAQEMPPIPKPGPEHEIFKHDEGTWDATIEMMMPDGQKMTSKGVETSRVGCGGLCLVTEFKGETMPGQPFEGQGIMTWDSTKKKYIGGWADSMSMGLSISEGTFDPAKETFTAWMEGPDQSGNVVKMRSVSEYKGNTRVMSIYAPGPDGRELLEPVLRITYTKRAQ
ncbi:MAG TPA: DUF1579 family protein [Vicinamibacterales bacterium]